MMKITIIQNVQRSAASWSITNIAFKELLKHLSWSAWILYWRISWSFIALLKEANIYKNRFKSYPQERKYFISLSRSYSIIIFHFPVNQKHFTKYIKNSLLVIIDLYRKHHRYSYTMDYAQCIAHPSKQNLKLIYLINWFIWLYLIKSRDPLRWQVSRRWFFTLPLLLMWFRIVPLNFIIDRTLFFNKTVYYCLLDWFPGHPSDLSLSPNDHSAWSPVINIFFFSYHKIYI